MAQLEPFMAIKAIYGSMSHWSRLSRVIEPLEPLEPLEPFESFYKPFEPLESLEPLEPLGGKFEPVVSLSYHYFLKMSSLCKFCHFQDSNISISFKHIPASYTIFIYPEETYLYIRKFIFFEELLRAKSRKIEPNSTFT